MLYVHHMCIHTHIHTRAHTIYRKSPTYKTSSCELSKTGTCLPSASGAVKLQPALRPRCWRPFSLTISRLPSLLQSGTVLAQCRPLEASCWTVLQYFTRYYTLRFTMWFWLFIYFSCKEYSKTTTVQYYIADCFSWVHRLTLLDFVYKQIGLSECALRTQLVSM